MESFDIGGSYESVVELYGGRVGRIVKDGPRLNPFTLEPTQHHPLFGQAAMAHSIGRARKEFHENRVSVDPMTPETATVNPNAIAQPVRGAAR